MFREQFSSQPVSRKGAYMNIYEPENVTLAADLPLLLEQIAKDQLYVRNGNPMDKEINIPSHKNTCVIDEYLYVKPAWKNHVKIFRAIEIGGTHYFLVRKLDSFLQIESHG